MPQSPRHLMNTGREEECLQTLARLRGTTTDDLLVRIEHLEIKSLYMFERETAAEKYPHLQDGSFKSNFKMGLNDYMSLITNKSLFKRTSVAVCVLFLSVDPKPNTNLKFSVYDHGVPAVERY